MDVTTQALTVLALLSVGALCDGSNVTTYAIDTCDRPGFMCSADCGTLFYCASVSTGYSQVAVDTCNANVGLYCSVKEGRCSTTANSCRLPGSTFTCTSAGYFPDPYDCTEYHVCMHFPNSVPEYAPVMDEYCPAGTAYNPLTTACNLKLTDSVCTNGPVPTCTAIGQIGPVPSDPHLYYLCVRYPDGSIGPNIFACEGDYVYQTGAGCVPNIVTTTVAPPTNGKCTQPGVIADPYNCHAYYICDSYLNARHGWCCIGFYYNVNRHRCMLGFC